LDVLDSALPGSERRDLVGVDVEAQHPKAGFAEAGQQRQPDVAQADDADLRLAALDLRDQAVH
jgi:hypothetical protein